MSDLISRQEAIERIENQYRQWGEEYDVMQILGDLEDLPSAQKWIPCSERLPNRNGCYLVWRPHFWGNKIGMPAICYFDGQNTWHDSYGVDFERTLPSNNVIAWMPLPQAYKAESEDKE